MGAAIGGVTAGFLTGLKAGESLATVPPLPSTALGLILSSIPLLENRPPQSLSSRTVQSNPKVCMVIPDEKTFLRGPLTCRNGIEQESGQHGAKGRFCFQGLKLWGEGSIPARGVSGFELKGEQN